MCQKYGATTRAAAAYATTRQSAGAACMKRADSACRCEGGAEGAGSAIMEATVLERRSGAPARIAAR